MQDRLFRPRIGVVVFALDLSLGMGANTSLASPQTAKPTALDKETEALNPQDISRIENVIRDQLAAFAADDAEAAFSHASPVIQKRFGNADRFIAMVRSGYAPLLKPRMVSFDDATKGDGVREIIQPVTLSRISHVIR